MPCCVLRVSGRDFDPTAFLRVSPVQTDSVYRRGEARPGKGVHDAGGFTILVSEAEEFAELTSDATRVLHTRRTELMRLVAAEGVEHILLDFGCDFPYRRVSGRYHRLPLDLIRECASLGIEIEVSVYAAE